MFWRRSLCVFYFYLIWFSHADESTMNERVTMIFEIFVSSFKQVIQNIPNKYFPYFNNCQKWFHVVKKMHLSLRYQIPWLNVMCLILKYFDFLIFELWYYVIVRSWNFWNSSNNKLEILSTQQECFCSWEKIKEVFLLKKVLKKDKRFFGLHVWKNEIFSCNIFIVALDAFYEVSSQQEQKILTSRIWM